MEFGLILIIIIIFIFIALLSPRIKEAENSYIGRVGEETTESVINNLSCCEYTLTNLYIPTVKGNTTEIDLIAFTNRGILVLETKNYSGTIHGNEDDNDWFAAVYGRNNYFHNPIKQNATHTKYLDRAIALNVPIYSIIVFSDRCSLEYISDSFNDVYICQMSTLRETIDEIMDNNSPCVSSFVLETVYRKLTKYSNPSEEIIRKHNEYGQSKKWG